MFLFGLICLYNHHTHTRAQKSRGKRLAQCMNQHQNFKIYQKVHHLGITLSFCYLPPMPSYYIQSCGKSQLFLK
jgi:hypothetical protein